MRTLAKGGVASTRPGDRELLMLMLMLMGVSQSGVAPVVAALERTATARCKAFA